MNFSVEPQPFMSHDIWMIVAGVVLVLIAVAALAVGLVLSGRRKSAMAGPVPQRARRSMRSSCESELMELKARLESGSVGPREACEKASHCVRAYASAVSRRPYSSMTLDEIDKALPGSNLSEAISRCYGNEFPEDPVGDAELAIDECLKAVGSWS